MNKEDATLKDTKRSIRGKVMQARSAIKQNVIEYKSLLIINRLLELELFNKSRLIMCYMDFRNEVRTSPLIEKCFAMGKKVALPRVVKTDACSREIRVYEISNNGSDIEKGSYGILEPKQRVDAEVDPLDIDLVIVPGVAFDIHKNRVGYGAGYYDRFLKKVRPDCRKLAIAFEMQIIHKIPADDTDIPVDSIITEKRIIV